MNINDKFKKLKNPVLEGLLRDISVRCTAILSDNQEIMNYLDASLKETTDPNQKALLEKLLNTRYNATASFISGINSFHESLMKLDKCDSAYQSYLEKMFPNEEIKKVLDQEQRVEFSQEEEPKEEVAVVEPTTIEQEPEIPTESSEIAPEEVSSAPAIEEETEVEFPQAEVAAEVPVEVAAPETEIPAESSEIVPEEETSVPEPEVAAVELPQEEVATEMPAENNTVESEIPEIAVEEAPSAPESESPAVELPQEEAVAEIPAEGPVPLQPLSPSVESESVLPFPNAEIVVAPSEENQVQESNQAPEEEENAEKVFLKQTDENAKGLIVTDKQLSNLKSSKEEQEKLVSAIWMENNSQENTANEIPEDILDKINELYMSGKTEEAQELSNKVLTKK